MEKYKAGVGGRVFLRAWIDDTLPPGLIRPAEEVVADTVRHIAESLKRARPGTIHLMIGHDFGIVLVRDLLLGTRFESEPWVSFLDGVVFVSNTDGIQRAIWRGRKVPLRKDGPEGGIV